MSAPLTQEKTSTARPHPLVSEPDLCSLTQVLRFFRVAFIVLKKVPKNLLTITQSFYILAWIPGFSSKLAGHTVKVANKYLSLV